MAHRCECLCSTSQLGCLIQHCVLFCQNASGVYASGPGPWEVSPASSRMLWIMTLLQCQLAFHLHPQQYTTDSTKVFFAISYLKKSALEWFENGVMELDPVRAPRWCSSWIDFTSEICTHFGPANPVGSTEIELHHLNMSYKSWISEYLV